MENWKDGEIYEALKAAQKRAAGWHGLTTNAQKSTDRESILAFVAEMNKRAAARKQGE